MRTLPLLTASLLLQCHLGQFAAQAAEPVQNPYYSEVDWKDWQADPSPIRSLFQTSNILTLEDPSGWQQPVDVTPAEAEAGQFIKFVPYASVDPLERIYTGFNHYFYGNGDEGHSPLRTEWSVEGPNIVHNLTDAIMYHPMGSFGFIREDVMQENGLTFGNSSVSGAGNYTTIPSVAQYLDEDVYFRNTTLLGPSAGYTFPWAYAPNILVVRGGSFSPQYAFQRLLVTGAYLPRQIRTTAAANGLLPSIFLSGWKQALPYRASLNDPVRHRSIYDPSGVEPSPYYTVTTPDDAFNHYKTITEHYNPTQHSRNLVNHFKNLRVVPPIAVADVLEITGGTLHFDTKTIASIRHYRGETATARVSTAGCFDLQGYPLDYQWTVLYGNKNAKVEYLGDEEWLITVPTDPNLPGGFDGRFRQVIGRTDLMLTVSNGHTVSNPASVSFLLWDTSLDDMMVGNIGNVWTRLVAQDNYQEKNYYWHDTPPTGLKDAKILPGETYEVEVFADDPYEYPLHYTQWEGAGGSLDGSLYSFTPPLDAEESDEELGIIAASHAHEETLHGAKALVQVRKTVAEPAGDVLHGRAPLTVNFDGAASRDRDGNVLTYSWEFDDGSSPATGPAPSHTFTTPGFYDVTLTVTGPLGSDSTVLRVEVLPDWQPLVDNGWDGSGLDDAVWQNSGSDIDISANRVNVPTSGGSTTTYYRTMTMKTEGVLTSVPTVAPPVLIDAQLSYWENRESWIEIFGHKLGQGVQTNFHGYEIGADFGMKDGSAGAASETDFIAAHEGRGIRALNLRVYVTEDPVNPGKLRMRGTASASSGFHTFSYDNLDAGLSDKIRISTENLASMSLHRFRVWSPAGSGLTTPSLTTLDAHANVIEHPYLKISSDSIASWNLDEAQFFGVPATLGATIDKQFFIRNDGNAPLVLASQPVIAAEGFTTWGVDPSPAFQVLSQPGDLDLAPGEQTSFTIRYNPAGQPQESARIFVLTQDNTAHARFWVKGHSPTPANVLVRGNFANIPAGSTETFNQNFTQFGEKPLGESVTHEFLIMNTGHEPLTVTGVSLAGSPDFSVTTPPRLMIGPHGSAEMEITFTPSSTGVHEAAVSVETNDADTPVYTFAISGEGLPAQAPPSAEIRGNGLVIVDGDTSPDLADFTDFGALPIDNSELVTRRFEVASTGGAMEILGVNLSGVDAQKFTVLQQPATHVAGGHAAPFVIGFSPHAVRSFSATVSVLTNDPVDPEKTFAISAEGSAGGKLVVEGNGYHLQPENTVTWDFNNTYYGYLSIGQNTTRTYTLRNLATQGDLSDVSVSISGRDASSFSVDQAPSTTITPGGTSTLRIRFSPVTGQTKRAEVHIQSSDPRRPTFVFAIKGSSQFLQLNGSLDLPDFREGEMTWGDFDRDGDLDLAFAGQLYDSGFSNGAFVYLNDAGTFVKSQITENFPYSITSLDFDGDNDLDLAVGIFISGSGPGFQLFRNNNGVFTSVQQFATSVFGHSLEAFDYDGDGDPDVALSGLVSGGGFGTLMLRNDAGTFSVDDALGTLPSTNQNPIPSGLASGDLNKDGWVDLVISGASSNGSPETLLLLNQGAGTGFDVITLSPGALGEPSLIDYNDDGFLDIAVGATRDDDISLMIYLNNGDGENFTLQEFAIGDSGDFRLTAWGDYNVDGLPDFVTMAENTTSGHQAMLFRNTGSGFQQDDSLNAVYLRKGDLLMIDLEMDGGLDLASAGTYQPPSGGLDGLINVYNNIDEETRSTPPSAPPNVTVTPEGNFSLVQWSPAFDPDSSSHQLTYNIRIGYESGSGSVRPAAAEPDSGRRHLSAPGSFRTTTARFALPPGNYVLAVQAIDGGYIGGAWSEEVAFTVGHPINFPPTAAADDFTATPLLAGQFRALNLLSNDTDPNPWDTLSLASATDGSWGTTAVEEDVVIYSASAAAPEGIDSFTYTITDGVDVSDPAPVQIRIVRAEGTYDGDTDNLPDGWELTHYGNLAADGSGDLDDDGVSDADEFADGRNPAGEDYQALDWIEDFESYTPGPLAADPDLWTLPAQGAAEIQSGIGVGASQGLLLTTAEQESLNLIQYLQTGFQPVLWLEFTAKLAPYSDTADAPAVDPETNSAFYLTESAKLRALDGAIWQEFSTGFADLETDHRYTVRQDYVNRQWELWIDGSLITDPPLAFNSASNRQTLKGFRLTQDEQQESRFDNISISTAAPPGLDQVQTYATWHDAISWAGDETPLGNPNGNNLLNLQEYAFGFNNPVLGTHVYQTGMSFDPAGPWLSLTYRRNRTAEDIRFIVQSSGDLGSWKTVYPPIEDVTINDLGGGIEEVSVRVPASADALFLQLKTILRE